MRLTPLAEARDPSLYGGKAAHLAEAMAGGLPVPAGYVVPASEFVAARERAIRPGVQADDLSAIAQHLRQAALPAALADGLAAACAELTFPLIARSSATVEDRATARLPGILDSVAGLADVGAVLDAIRQVWASLYREEALAYLAHRGIALADSAVAVLLQEQVPGARLVLYTRDPADGLGPPVCELRRTPGSDPVLVMPAEGGGDDLRRLRDALRPILAPAERIVGAGADVELIDSDGGLRVVQVRPMPPPAAIRFPVELAGVDRDLSWRWDATHNPAPLSGAQQGLVEWIEARGELALRQRVLGRYLFYAWDPRRGGGPPVPTAGLRRRYDAELRARLLELAESVGPAGDRSMRAALDRYLEFYRRYAGELAPVLRTARRALLDAVAPLAHGEERDMLVSRLLAGTPTATLERDEAVHRLAHALGEPSAERAALADLLALAGPLSETWDVAAPSYEEDPTPLLHAARAMAADRLSPRLASQASGVEAGRVLSTLTAGLPPARASELRTVVTAAREALAIGEDDDTLFARAQRGIRRGLLRLGRRWRREGRLADSDLIFELPLERVLEWEGSGPPPDLDGQANAARAERLRAGVLLPPDRIEGGRPIYLATTLALDAPSLAGRGFGGRVRGIATLRPPSHPGPWVLVVPTALPSLTSRFAAARALVTDHGGLLDHGVAQAREYGLAGVVGTGAATRAIPEGAEVIVDGPRGRVYVLTGRPVAPPAAS